MRLIFVRHAEAEEQGHGVAGRDEQRRITKRGRQETRWVADALNRLGIRPKLVFTSPLVRSRQTAEILSERIKHAPEPVETQALAPGAGWAQLKREIARHGAVLAGRKAATTLIVIVGHQPGLSEMIIEALSGSPADFRFQKSACIGLEWEDDKPAGTPALFLALEPETARLVAKL